MKWKESNELPAAAASLGQCQKKLVTIHRHASRVAQPPLSFQLSSLPSPYGPPRVIESPHRPQLNALLPFQGLPTDPIQIKSINVFPDPPKPGQNLTVTVEASAQEKVEVRLHPLVSCSPIRSDRFSGGCICRCSGETRPYQVIA